MAGASPSPYSRRNRRSRSQQFTQINVTPFVDVMLVLLVIFMVTAPMLTAGVEVDLPESSADQIGGKDEPLSVTIKPNGVVYIQESKILAENLVPKLKAIVGQKMDSRIFVRGDKQVSYGEVMGIVGQISAAGFRKVALVTEPQQRER